ncbi:hypothetical protein NPIL_288451 [Nephila pilipes]|uniref:Uncharacterized protein n=1 Tax=Nephila pilipes TaxID=299642 RepID=A0A8X6P9Y2_NEPPI|nr:hypothetical protein NPIL_288451 [Nephila pilipes]
MFSSRCCDGSVFHESSLIALSSLGELDLLGITLYEAHFQRREKKEGNMSLTRIRIRDLSHPKPETYPWKIDPQRLPKSVGILFPVSIPNQESGQEERIWDRPEKALSHAMPEYSSSRPSS